MLAYLINNTYCLICGELEHMAPCKVAKCSNQFHNVFRKYNKKIDGTLNERF